MSARQSAVVATERRWVMAAGSQLVTSRCRHTRLGALITASMSSESSGGASTEEASQLHCQHYSAQYPPYWACAAHQFVEAPHDQCAVA